MELRSARRLRRSPPSRHGTPSRGMDLLSALPDEMLLQVLARLRCVGSAVQTSLISRRWRSLWTGLWVGPTDLTFSGLEPATIEALFRRYAASAQVSTLAIGLSQSAGANSLLRAAVGLSPGHLIFTLHAPVGGYGGNIHIELPCFEGTTSIDLVMPNFSLELPLAGEFTALESLSVEGGISDLGPLPTCCPRLRELSVTYPAYRRRWGILRMPDGGEFPALEKLSLSGEILDTTSLVNNCQRVRVLSVTQLEARPLRLMLPPYGEFPMLEKLSLSGNIADLGILLNRCPRLHVLSVTLRGMGPHRLKAVLTTLEKVAPLGLMLDTLRIEIPEKDDISAARFASLLGAMERLSPKELVVPDNFKRYHVMHKPQIKANLPCFAHATSIDISPPNVCFKSLKPGEFSMLERLSLSRLHNIIDMNTLVTRCPRLRVLKATVPTGQLTIHSALLQKLDLRWRFGAECHGIDIVTPVLKQLRVSVYADKEIGVTISAPMVENVLWHHSYTRPALVFGSWCLQTMRVGTMDMRYVTKREGMRSFMQQQHHPPFHALCLHLNTDNQFDAELNFAHEVEKLQLVNNFYMLEINFEAAWHVYGALVLRLLRMTRTLAATTKLNIFLPFRPKGEQEACLQNCACDKPKNWRRQSIFRTNLEEVEIHNSNGEDHEYDFLRLILKCSPMLKSVRMRYRRSYRFDGCTTELSNISLAHPSVKFCN